MRAHLSLLLTLAATVVCAGDVIPESPKIIEPAAGVRIKDLADVLGVRENQLVGQGIVVGLDGTGDRTGIMAPQALSNMLARMGINIPATQLKPKNMAVVAVTAQMPPFVKKGGKLDVQVSSMGDATSLAGGVLVQCPLVGGDGRVYAVAQGALSIGGFNVNSGAGAGTASIQKNHTLVGRIPNGALTEREIETCFEIDGVAKIILRKADFTTAQRMAEAINKKWPDRATATDPHTVEFNLPHSPDVKTNPMAILAELESIRFQPDVRARVVINERTGTIVAGSEVRLIPTVLSHGNLYIKIKNTPFVAQPGPFAPRGSATVAGSDGAAGVTEEDGQAILLEPKTATLGDLAAALNALKVKPRDIISIFQALKEAGALNAELLIL